MTSKPRAIYHGSVPAFEPSFQEGKFKPFNDAYAMFVPSDEPIDGPYGAVLEVFEGEWFSVDVYRSEGLPTEFLHYRDAYLRAQGTGEQGSVARISICTPVDDYILTAVDADGSRVPVFNRKQYMSPRVASRLVFPNR